MGSLLTEVFRMTYEYLCTLCGHAWEAEQSISAAPLKECPSCHQEGAKRQVSGGAGFILKGGGWYADLYGSAPKKSASDSESKAASDSGAKDASTKDASPKKESTPSDKGGGSSGTSGSSSSGSSGTPTSGTPSGSKGTGAASGA